MEEKAFVGLKRRGCGLDQAQSKLKSSWPAWLRPKKR
jgi:hypothetical protein